MLIQGFNLKVFSFLPQQIENPLYHAPVFYLKIKGLKFVVRYYPTLRIEKNFTRISFCVIRFVEKYYLPNLRIQTALKYKYLIKYA